MTDQKKTRRQVLEEFVKKSPGDAFSRYGLAMECMSSGDPAAAALNFGVLLDKHPDYIPAYLMYGQLWCANRGRETLRKYLSWALRRPHKTVISTQRRRWKRC